MNYLTLGEFISTHAEGELWEIIDEYENWYVLYENNEKSTLLWKKTEEYCFSTGIRPLDVRIVAQGAYRHFALKYKEMVK